MSRNDSENRISEMLFGGLVFLKEVGLSVECCTLNVGSLPLETHEASRWYLWFIRVFFTRCVLLDPAILISVAGS